MKISPIKNRSKVITVNEAIGRMLVSKGKFVVADPYEKKVIGPSAEMNAELDAAGDRGLDPPEVEISPRTGLPKRVYRRRDMESE